MSNRIRVLIVNHTSKISGGEHSLLDMLGPLAAKCEVLLAVPPGQLAERAQEMGVAWTPIDEVSLTYRLRPADTAIGIVSLLRSGRGISEAASRLNAQVVLANSVRAALAACTATLHGTPVVAYIRDLSPRSLAGALVRKVVGRRATVLIANSRYTAGPWTEAGLSVRVLHNGIDLKRFRPLDAQERDTMRSSLRVGDGPVLVMAGQITPWKGQADAVSAVARLVHTYPALRLLIVGRLVFEDSRFGNTAYEQALHDQVHRAGLDQTVIFTGERPDIEKVLGAADVALMPSWQEPFGRVGLEAMAVGTAVVATTEGGPREFISHGQDGILVPPRSPDLLANAIDALLRDEETRGLMQRAARRTAERHPVSDHLNKVLEILERTSGAGAPPAIDQHNRSEIANRSLRVLVANHTARVSGAEHYLLALASALEGAVDFHLACPDGELARRALAQGLSWTPLRSAELSFRLHPLRTTRGVLDLAAMARDISHAASTFKADLIHANSVRAGLAVRMIPQRHRPPALVFIHDIVPAHGVGRLVQSTLRSGVVLVANSEATAAVWGSHSARVRVASPGVDLDRFSPNQRRHRPAVRAEFGLGDGPVLVLVGQLTPWKGHVTAIEAVEMLRQRHEDIKLLIVGSVVFDSAHGRNDNLRYRDQLHQMVHGADLDGNVVFTGERRDVERLLAASDMALVPSWHEPFGLAVLEALATGTPVLATDQGGPQELIDNGVNGLLLPPRQAEAWATSVANLLAHPEKRESMGRAGRAAAVKHGLAAHATDIAGVYELVARRG